MPIIGLTDRGAAFPRLGVLRKGGEKKDERRPGPDLNYFRFDTDDEAALEAFHAAYSDEPRHINVYLPYATTVQNLEAWNEAWTAASLQHRCDGVTMTRWLTPGGKYSAEPRPCPGGCKPVGRLMVIIPELRRFAYVTVQTTSIHDIMTLQANLEAAEMLRGDLRGIPFVLSRRERDISTPRGDGKRARVSKWLLSIEPAPAWVGHQLAVMEQAALPHVKALPDGRHVDTMSGEIIDAPPPFDEEPAREPDPPPQLSPEEEHAQRKRLAARIRALWAKERELGGDNPEKETGLDLMKIETDELVKLGRRVRKRVDALVEAARAADTETADGEPAAITEDDTVDAEAVAT